MSDRTPCPAVKLATLLRRRRRRPRPLHRRLLSSSRASTLATAVVIGSAIAALDAQGQQRFAAIDSLRRIQSVVPRIGPPGTHVEIYTENLPPQAKIHVGVGAMRAGFEALAEAKQEMWGEVSATVRIPRYATWERPIVFIVFNGVFSPIGISEPFHVTNAEGFVRRTGRITDGSPGCQTLRDADQYLYALTGESAGLAGLEPGDEVVVEGPVTESGPCGGADQIEVVRWERAPRSVTAVPTRAAAPVRSTH